MSNTRFYFYSFIGTERNKMFYVPKREIAYMTIVNGVG